MRKTALLSLIALSVAAHAADSSHRLAYSKAENVEVFADHPADRPWCGEELQLRFAFAGTSSQEAIERLMPKLGGLLANQCPQAVRLHWTSQDQQGQQQAQGTASKSGAWLAQSSQVAPDQAAVAMATAKPAEEAATRGETPAPEVTATAPAAAPAEVVPVPVAPAVPVVAAETAVVEAPAPVQPVAPAEAVAPVVAPVAEAKAAEQAAENSVAAVAVANTDFTVSGWKPSAESEVLAKASFLNVVQDQNGCRFRLNYKPEVATEFLVVESSGVSCGADGFASGPGELLLKRSDGVELKRIKAHFQRGLPIVDGPSDLQIADITANGDLLLLVSSDLQQRVYHLLRSGYNGYHGGWVLGDGVLLVLTENIELFRNQQSIHSTLLLPIERFTHLRPKISGIRSYAMDDLAKGLYAGNRDFWLYEITLRRDWRSKQWRLNPNNATNHLFKREQRRAEVARREAERQAREEQHQRERQAYAAEEQLNTYRSLEQQAKRPADLARQLLRDIDAGSGYRALMDGDSRPISQIVQVVGGNDKGWRLDYPYEAELHSNSGESLSDGWYLVSGKVSLDPQRRDAHELPLTLIQADVLEPCKDVGCLDRMQPLSLMRQRLNDPDWSPEQAIAQVRAAWPDRYTQPGQQE